MIVPRNRLILWTSLIVLPFAAVGATLPGALAISLFFIGALVFIAGFDAFTVRGKVAGIRVMLPELVRLQRDRPANIELRIENESTVAQTLRVGLAFPHEISPAEDTRLVSLPSGVALTRFDWLVTPLERGQFFLDRVFLERVSPFGFWAVRSSQTARLELRVYPSLFAERRNVAAIFLRHARLGSRALRRAGQGREFEKLREYIPGDSSRRNPLEGIRETRTSRDEGVSSGTHARGLRDHRRGAPLGAESLRAEERRGVNETIGKSPERQTTVLERFVTAALILGAAAEQQGDQFGLLTFSDRVLSFVRAKSGQAHYDACRDRLYTLQPQSVTPDFDELCSFIRLRLRKRALLIFLTALDDPMLAESFTKSVDLICRQHLVLVNMLQPAGAVPLFSDTGVNEPDDLYAQLAGHYRWQGLRELETVLRRRGVRLSLLDSQKLAAQLVAQHADVKARQLI